MVAFGIRHAEVLYAAINEFLAQLSLELWVASVWRGLGGHIVTIHYLVLFGFAEPFEIFLQSSASRAKATASNAQYLTLRLLLWLHSHGLIILFSC